MTQVTPFAQHTRAFPARCFLKSLERRMGCFYRFGRVFLSHLGNGAEHFEIGRVDDIEAGA